MKRLLSSKGKNKKQKIYLYHITLKESLVGIKQKGLLPATDGKYRIDVLETKELRELLTEDELENIDWDTIKDERILAIISHYHTFREVGWFLERNVPEHSDSVFFYKVKDLKEITDIRDSEVVLRIRADKIGCKCREGNMDLSNNIVDSFFLGENYDQKSFKLNLYKKSIRDLDSTYNNYLTEVFCPCKINSKDMDLLILGKWVSLKNFVIVKRDFHRVIDYISCIADEVINIRILKKGKSSLNPINFRLDFQSH